MAQLYRNTVLTVKNIFWEICIISVCTTERGVISGRTCTYCPTGSCFESKSHTSCTNIPVVPTYQLYQILKFDVYCFPLPKFLCEPSQVSMVVVVVAAPVFQFSRGQLQARDWLEIFLFRNFRFNQKSHVVC